MQLLDNMISTRSKKENYLKKYIYTISLIFNNIFNIVDVKISTTLSLKINLHSMMSWKAILQYNIRIISTCRGHCINRYYRDFDYRMYLSYSYVCVCDIFICNWHLREIKIKNKDLKCQINKKKSITDNYLSRHYS